MTEKTIVSLIIMAAGAALVFSGLLINSGTRKRLAQQPENKKLKRMCTVSKVLMIFGGLLFATKLLPLVFGDVPHENFTVEISPPRILLGGFSVSSTVIVTWIAMGAVLIAAILLRIFVVPRMKDIPSGMQNLLEISVDGIQSYAGSKAHGLGEGLSAYLFSIAMFLVACAAVELFGLRAPTADITMTLALSLITFILINYYGFRQKGFSGRIKALADPTPIVFPLRVLSDFAIPISMACRLFGNMLGGLVVMELLYGALGSSAIGIPSVAGLYFNVFHPLIQAFIFITLTLTFIGEATE